MPSDNDNLPNKIPQNRLEEVLRDIGERAAFSPFFAERVQRRINTNSATNSAIRLLSPMEALAQELVWMFQRFAIIGASVAVLLAGYNLYTNGDVSVDAAFGLPNETSDDVSAEAGLITE